MLERFFLKPQTVDRIMGCWLGPRIELYVMALCEQGYSARSIIRRVPILTEFAEFAAARHADRVDRAETLLDAFVVDWLSARRLDRPADARRRDRNLVRGTVRHFFSLVVSKCDYHPDKAAWADPFAGQVSGFFEYLREERGLRPSSIHHYQHYLRRFERYLDQVGCSDLGALALPVITGFITASAQEFGFRAMVCLASTLRVFLRYAYREGILPRDLAKLIEVPQHYRMADIPRSIAKGQPYHSLSAGACHRRGHHRLSEERPAQCAEPGAFLASPCAAIATDSCGSVERCQQVSAQGRHPRIAARIPYAAVCLRPAAGGRRLSAQDGRRLCGASVPVVDNGLCKGPSRRAPRSGSRRWGGAAMKPRLPDPSSPIAPHIVAFVGHKASPEPAVRCRGQGAANVRWLSEHRGDHDPCRDYPSCRRRILLEPNTYTTAKFQSLGRGYWPIVRVDGRTWHRRSLARHDETTPRRPATSALYSGPANSPAACRLGRTACRSEHRAAPRPCLFDDL